MKSYSGLTMVELIYEEDYDKTNPCRFALPLTRTAHIRSQMIMLRKLLRHTITSRIISR